MREISLTIAPIFIVILLGAIIRRLGLISGVFAGPANKLVYYLAIPAMVFSKISKSSLDEVFHPEILAGTLIPALVVGLIGAAFIKSERFPKSRAATMFQSGYHGNLGYIGLAVAYYYLGESGLVRASILSGFLMLVQNFTSVSLLSMVQGSEAGGGKGWFILKKISLHPVVLSAVAGIAFLATGLTMPSVLEKTLDILGGMALPLALLLIGGSLSLNQIKGAWKPAVAASLVKLFLIPALGLGFYSVLGLEPDDFMPGLILLCTPTATVVYVMAMEMNGEPDLASAAISVSTLGSALTYAFWLALF